MSETVTLYAVDDTNLKSQFATSSSDGMRSQIATASVHGGRRKLPYAFTEHGAIMAATVLNSRQAVEMSVFVVRAFVKMREQLMTTAALANRLAEVEKVLLTHDSALQELYQTIRPLLLPPPETDRPKIGFGVHEPRATYRIRRKRTSLQ
ncbi:MAG: ORF6N domain-containing protein [Kiritimatiellia bacterium]